MDGSAPAFLLGIAENGITFVVLGTVAFSLLMSVLFLVTKGTDSLYDQIGQGGISREDDTPGAGGQQLDSAAARAEQELEIRQMLAARNERLLRRGEPALDVDAEVARLLEATPRPEEQDATLTEEVRQLVIARNERRVRQGLEELDVDSEVARTLEELNP
ncbi:MAG TPA: hypothetical protein VLZ06_00490 [Solirubrobacteraceae bacterium]|nr:hypothetical protein [Solirubrobacteraceae bacterium]